MARRFNIQTYPLPTPCSPSPPRISQEEGSSGHHSGRKTGVTDKDSWGVKRGLCLLGLPAPEAEVRGPSESHPLATCQAAPRTMTAGKTGLAAYLVPEAVLNCQSSGVASGHLKRNRQVRPVPKCCLFSTRLP